MGSELIVSCLVSKAAIVARMQLEELGMKQLGPTLTAMDANAVMQGAEMDRISKQSRWLAARLAILRQTVGDGQIRLIKVLSAVHVPDIFTKGITDREKFQQLRDYLLGSPDGPMPALVSALLSAAYDAEESAAEGGAAAAESGAATRGVAVASSGAAVASSGAAAKSSPAAASGVTAKRRAAAVSASIATEGVPRPRYYAAMTTNKKLNWNRRNAWNGVQDE